MEQLIGRQPTQETLNAIAEVARIVNGEQANTVTVKQDRIMGMNDLQTDLHRIVDMGRVVADPAYVIPADWADFSKRRNGYWFFHTDAISLFIGKKYDLLTQFFAVIPATKPPPIYRVRMPRPIMVSGIPAGGTMDESLLAMEISDISELAKHFIAQCCFPRRFSEAQRARYKQRTNRNLLDQYWEVVGHEVSVTLDGRPLPFMLFLPSGLEFQLLPLDNTDPVQFSRASPEHRVRVAGLATLSKGYAAAGENNA